ncbi:MAG: VOC family protein [Bacteroidota bacterium]
MKRSQYLLSLIVAFAFGIIVSKALPAFHKAPAKKATGIGGIFFKCKDPKKMREWYAKELGLQVNQYGTSFQWYQGADSTKKGFTQWSLFKETSKYFEPGKADFMINYRVENLVDLLRQLKSDGVTVTDTIETASYGKFVHILDAENNKVELWEPVDSEYGKFGGITK